MNLRILVPVTGAFHGRLRVRRSTGELDSEGVERVLSTPSAQALTLAQPLMDAGAHVVAVHVDKGGGAEILREALAYGVSQAILIEGTTGNSDASTRASTIADVYRQSGPFDAVIGPGVSAFGGFTGALAAMAGQLGLPIVHGVQQIRLEGDQFRIGYTSIFGEYDLRIPRPSVIVAGDIPVGYPTAWGIADAYRGKGLLRVQAEQYAKEDARTKRVRIETSPREKRSPEEVDGSTLVRRLRSRAMLPEASS